MTIDAYYWSLSSIISIEDYVKKNNPSLVNDLETSWIWVSGEEKRQADPERENHAEALVQAQRVLKDLENQLKVVESDQSIPVRASKGKKSKSQMRNEFHDDAKKDLKDISIKLGWTCGKCEVNAVWQVIAPSVANGPLKEAGVFLAKVAPTPTTTEVTGDTTHVICLYIRNVYDLKVVRKVLEVLLGKHGLEPSAVKSDLYTLVGVDSNHPTKLRSTIWRPAEVLEGGMDAVKAMKIPFKRAEGSQRPKKKMRADGIIESDSEDDRISILNKRALPTGINGEKAPDIKAGRHTASVEGAPTTKTKRAKHKAVIRKENDIFGGDSD